MAERVVLIVEDDARVVAQLGESLREHPLSTRVARDSATAIQLLESGSFCGLVLDLVLDSGSGFDVLRYLNRNRIELPTVVISSKLPDYVRELLVEDQVKLILAKPLDMRLLTTIVLGLCGIMPPSPVQ
jgi:DNA-binding response OmpR family regulator